MAKAAVPVQAGKRAPRDSARVKAARERYAVFLEANPTASVQEFGKAKQLIISTPWGDSSLAILIPEDDEALLRELSAVLLPPRYSAIYHKETKRVEVIWTAYKLSADQQEIVGREFALRLRGKTHKCAFGQSSEVLLEIARHWGMLMMSNTEFRNLRAFTGYLRAKAGMGGETEPYGEPISFWIDDVEWDEESFLDLARHINFYLSYYDSESPVITIHSLASGDEINPRSRYVEGKFPAKIVSKPLRPTLLVFYSAAFSGDAASNFLNLYRIIEFVSYGYRHEAAHKLIQSILNRPSALDDVDRSASELLMVLREMKLEREQDAILKLLQEVIQPDRLWMEVCQNMALFSKPTKFEGDLQIKALVSAKHTLDTFKAHGVSDFARAITEIRNALAHARDSKTAKTILPTSRNFELLQPWLHLIAAAAAEVVLYDSAH